jgi:hypothetical protein
MDGSRVQTDPKNIFVKLLMLLYLLQHFGLYDRNIKIDNYLVLFVYFTLIRKLLVKARLDHELFDFVLLRIEA